MIRASFLLVAMLGSALTLPAAAHFQQIIPSEDVLPNGGEVTLNLIFTHPFEGGPVTNMKRPETVGALINGQKTDLTDQLVEQTTDGATSWTLSHDLPEPGVAVFYVTPQPYWEPAENIYIKHHAKVIVDSYALGTGWDALQSVLIDNTYPLPS